MDPYADLGVPRNASTAEIKRAYRKRVQKEHPDKGGSKEGFQRLQLAYDVLSDEARKARFDKFGESGNDSIEQQALAEVASMFVILAGQHDVDHTNIQALIVQSIQEGERQRRANIAQLQGVIAKLERAKKRVKKKTEGVNLAVQFFDADIVNKRNAIAKIERELERGALMLKIVQDYEYMVEKFSHTTPTGMLGGFGGPVWTR